MPSKRFGDSTFNSQLFDASGTTPNPPSPGAGGLGLVVGSNDWTARTFWGGFKFSFRQGVGVAATFELDTTGVTETAPGCEDEFVLTLPTAEVFILVPTGKPVTLYRQDAHDIALRDTVHTYETIDIISALDRKPLPVQQFIESNAGEIISTLIGAIDARIDTTGVAAGNSVPYLDTADFSKLSDIVKSAGVATGGYSLQVEPNKNGGYAAKADYKDNFGVSGIAVDKDSEDFTPQKEPIEPDNNIVNYQRVKSSKPGPHHTVCEFRERDALNASFKLKTLPYGLDGTELLNFQVDQGDIVGTDSTSLPKIVPLHYPVQIEIADISLGGSGELFGFLGRTGTVLSLLASPGSIGANVSGTSYTHPVPFLASAHAPDTDHQFYYDFHAQFGTGGLSVSITENYLNNLAGVTPLAVVTSLDMSAGVVGLNLTGVATIDQLPQSIRFFSSIDPTNVRGFSTIVSRSGNSIVIDNIPTNLVVGDSLASGDSARVTVTEQVVYSGAAPSNRYGKPQVVISGGSGVTARQWTASYGPGISIDVLPNLYTGAPGRKLRVDTVASSSTDIVVSASGNTAICTFVGDRLPLQGDIQLLINYDAAKIVDITVQDAGSQAKCGIRQGAIITSDAVLTAAEATVLGQAVLDEFANPKPKGTIVRESPLTTRFPLPNETALISVPSEYFISDAAVPISDVSIDFGGYSWELDDGILIYHIALGNLDAQDAVNRQLLANQTSLGIQYRPLSAPGARISSASWDDVSVCSLGISGSIAINGIPTSTTFNPANFATGNFREAPVVMAGTTTSGSDIGELLVEVIYPPLDIDAASETCTYSSRTNLVTYRWGRPAGVQEYWVKRLIDDGTSAHTLVFKQVDKIFSESYPLPYEPASHAVQIQTIGLADKKGAGGYIQLECTLPQMPAPTTFQITPNKAVKPSGRIPLLVSAPPTIVAGVDFTNRAEYLRIFLTKSPVHDPATVRADFSESDVNLVTENLPVQGVTTAKRQVVYYEEFQPGEMVWITAMWVDKFGQEGINTLPFDVLHPPVTIGYIDLADFFQSATQANGGAVEDDNETTPEVEYTAKFRYHLGQNNDAFKMWFDESAAIINGGAYSADNQFTSHTQEVTDVDVVSGYADYIVKQRFRRTKKKVRNYRPNTITAIGPTVRQRNDGSGVPQNTPEKKFLVGYDSTIESPPTIVPHQVDAIFKKETFQFQPGINGLANNFPVVTGVTVTPKPEALKVRWDRFADDASVRRYFVVLSTVPFGTFGPTHDIGIANDLNLIASTGTLLIYNSGNTTRGTLVSVLDAGDTGHHTFQNGDVIGALTIASGVTYYVAVIAQIQNGRYSSDFSTVQNSAGGSASVGSDSGDAGQVVGLSMLAWTPKKGWRSIWQPPTTNYTAPRGYTVAYYFNNGFSTFWMNPDTGALLATTAGAAGDERNTANTGGIQVFVKVGDTRHTTGIAVNDSTLDPIFKTYGVKARVRAINHQASGDVISANFAETAVQLIGSDSQTDIPGALAVPTLLTDLIGNSIDGDPEKNLARMTLTLRTQNGQSFALNNITSVGLFAVEIDEGGIPLGSSNGKPDILPLTAALQATTSVSFDFYRKPAAKFGIDRVIAINGDKSTTTLCSIVFRSGNMRTVAPTDNFTVPAPTIGAITREDGSNKIDIVPITLTQNGTDIIWYKRFDFEVNINGGGWNLDADGSRGLKAEDALYTSTSATKTWNNRVKRKAGVSAQYRVSAVAVGGKISAVTTINSAGFGGTDVQTDTAGPNNNTPLTLTRAKFKKGSLLLDFVMPTLQMATHFKTVIILHDNNSTGTGRKFYDPITSSWVATYPNGSTELEIGKGGVPSLGIFKSEVFVGGRTNLYVRVGVWNQFNATGPGTGTPTYSPDVGQTGFLGPITLANSENESPTDQVVPGQPPAPKVKEQDGDVVVTAKPPITGANVITKWQLAVTDANVAPTTADPPTSTATVFDFVEVADGFAQWRLPGLSTSRYFWTRCKNANNPSTGGTGGNGWSDWSPSTVLTGTSRPLQDFIGSGVPTHATPDANSAQAYADAGGTIPITGQKVPVRIWDTTTDGGTIFFEIILPTDANALSLVALEYEIYKPGGGTPILKAKETLNPSTTTVLQRPILSWPPVFRFRLRNMYRTGGSNGWSAWTNYAVGPSTAVGSQQNNYNPVANPPPDNDFYSESSYPQRYLL
jgi:hypothetical protein